MTTKPAPADRVHSAERAAGKRATFHVYVKINGQLAFDPSWEATSEAAASSILKMYKEVHRRKTIELVRVVACNPSMKL